MADTEKKMVWSWDIVERIYNLSKVNIAALNLHDMVNTSPSCQRAMVNEYRASKEEPPVDSSKPVDGAEVNAVIADFFGLVIQKTGVLEKQDSGATPPTST
jgi:hypothetical protein